MKVAGWLFLLVFAGLSPWLIVHAQNLAFNSDLYVSDDYTLDLWTINDGLPVNSVSQVFQSSDGYIWMVTYAGVARFDGISFTVFNTENYPELPTNRFSTMFETQDRTLWFSTMSDRLISFKENRFQIWGRKNGLSGNLALDIQKKEDGTLWIGTESGITKFEQGKMKSFHPDLITGRIPRVFSDSDSTLFLKQNGKIFRFANDSLSVVLEGIPKDGAFYEPFLKLNNGNVLFGAKDGLYIYDTHSSNHSLKLVHLLSGGSKNINSLYETETGEILFNVPEEGVYRWNGTGRPEIYQASSARINAKEPLFKFKYKIFGSDTLYNKSRQLYRNQKLILQLPDNIINEYIYDREGSIWVGTYSSGVIRLKPNSFQTFSIPEGLTDRNMYPVFETKDGEILAGSLFGGLHVIRRDGSVNNVATAFRVQAIHELEDGTILTGKSENFVYEWSDEKGWKLWNPDTTRVHVPDDIFSIHQDLYQNVWVGSKSGLFLYVPPVSKTSGVLNSPTVSNEAGWRNLTEDLQMPDGPVRYFAPDPDGMLWMATAGSGVFGLNISDFEVREASFYPEAGNASGVNIHRLELPVEFVRSIYVQTDAPLNPPFRQESDTVIGETSSDGYYLWIGTEGHGLFRVLWDPGTQKALHTAQIQAKDGLHNNTIHQILDDGAGNFWMSTNAGILKASVESLHAWCDGDRSNLQTMILTEADGIRNREANGGMQPAGIRARDGTLWFPTQDGVVKIDPKEINENQLPPPVKIEHIQSDEKKWFFPDEVQLDTGRRNFEIRYAGLSYLAPEKITFSYKLEGFDETWLDAGTRRTAYYTNIPPGEYQFMVSAVNKDGMQSIEPATAGIHVIPYFYETPWFRWVLVLAGISLVTLWVRYRFKRVQRSEARLRKTVDERTAELKDAMEHLQELDKAKSRFFANMSHEFRTPLTLILGPLEGLLDKKTDPAFQQELSLIKRNGYRLKRLIDQVLDLVKLESGSMKPDLQPFDLQNYVFEVAELFSPLAEKHQLTLTVSGEAANAMVVADIDKVEHVLANLLSNAVKFTDEGGHIEVVVKDTPDRVMIHVRDTGKGIPREKMESIFDRFYQVDDSENRPAEGMGIGLALCRELMSLHHGSITVESEVGKGSTFTLEFLKGVDHFRTDEIDFSLVSGVLAKEISNRNKDAEGEKIPRKELEKKSFQPEAVTAEPPASGKINGNQNDSEAATKPVYGKDHTTLLLIEDHRDMRDYLASVLEQDYKILESSNGEEALELIEKTPPDLIIADIMMPVMDGLTFSRHLRENALYRNIPLLFLTARSDDADEIEGLQQGGNDYLAKPFNPNVLKARIAALLATQQRLRNQLLTEAGDLKSSKITQDSQKEVGNNWLSLLFSHLEKHVFDPSFGVDRLSEIMHMDRTQLYRKTKKYTNRSPVQLIKEARLKKARQLILEGETNYSEIAYACGFNSLSYLSRSYKKFFGHAPSFYQPGDAENEMESE